MSNEFTVTVEGTIRGEELFIVNDDTHKTLEDVFAEFENTTGFVRIEITELDPEKCPAKEYDDKSE